MGGLEGFGWRDGGDGEVEEVGVVAFEGLDHPFERASGGDAGQAGEVGETAVAVTFAGHRRCLS
jgi:hypothetical protein